MIQGDSEVILIPLLLSFLPLIVIWIWISDTRKADAEIQEISRQEPVHPPLLGR